jgi:hypothetical protein
LAGYNPILLNPDGWTRWHNHEEFTTEGLFGFTPGAKGNLPNPSATLNPYKLYADGLSATADAAGWLTANQDTRAFFSAGAANTREMQLQFPFVGDKLFLKWQYAVLASWAPPTSDDPGPDDFPPEANIGEAAHLRVDCTDSTLYYTIDEQGGDLVINLDVFDWQGGDAIKDEIDRIIVESKVLDDPYIDLNPYISQTAGSAFATYSVTLPADQVNSTDDVWVWVMVESADPTDYKNIDGPAYPLDKPLAAIAHGMAHVDDEAPPHPPEILSGIDIASGTTECPDRATDDSAVFEVVAIGDLPLSYSWSILEAKTFELIPGYESNPGDGEGHLEVDFTSPLFASVTSFLVIDCSVTDGVNPPIMAAPLSVYLDCVLFDADLEDPLALDNMGWTAFAQVGETTWVQIGGTDGGTNLVGTGALWQNSSGGVSSESSGILVSPPIRLPEFLSSAVIEVQHSYSFDPLKIGGNLKMGKPGTIESVTEPALEVASGKGYDGTIDDDLNPMIGQEAFSEAFTPSPLHTTNYDVPATYLGGAFMQLGFAAASGGTSYLDGGWLIDNVKITGEI